MKLFSQILSGLLISMVVFTGTGQFNLAKATGKCDVEEFIGETSLPNEVLLGTEISMNFKVTLKNNVLANNAQYTVKIEKGSGNFDPVGTAVASGGSITFTGEYKFTDEKEKFYLIISGPGLENFLSLTNGCSIHEFRQVSGLKNLSYKNIYIKQTRDGKTCYGGFGTASNSCLETGSPFEVIIQGLLYGRSIWANQKVWVGLDTGLGTSSLLTTDSSGNLDPISYHSNKVGSHTLYVEYPSGAFQTGLGTSNFFYKKQFYLSSNCNPDQCDQTEPTYTGSDNIASVPYKICDQIDQNKFKELYDNCITCVGDDEEGREGVWTAVGCIKKDPIQIVQNLIRIGLGMGGGVALLMILASGFIFSISQGDPKKVGDAKEMVVAAVTGLLFVIFSVTILEFIGYSVFRIPGFGG
ncbi:MAG: hypothetical protein ABIJ03_04460 [Patescibacteria group bacterium]